MTDRIPAIPYLVSAFAPEAVKGGPFNTFKEWLTRVGRETPVLRRAVLTITTPAVAANAVVLSRSAYTVNTVAAWGLSGSAVDVVVTPIFEDVILSHWYARPVWPLGLGAAPPINLVSIQMYAVGTVQCEWSNPTLAAHAGAATLSYEVILLRA